MFLTICSQFQETYIPLIEVLLTSQTELETFNKLVEILSTMPEHYNENKAVGKLLLHIVTSLGRNVHTVEPMLSHIIASHKSIWKSKIQKSLNINQQDSQLFSQSFR